MRLLRGNSFERIGIGTVAFRIKVIVGFENEVLELQHPTRSLRAATSSRRRSALAQRTYYAISVRSTPYIPSSSPSGSDAADSDDNWPAFAS
jgi:hypothetical protein